MKILPTIFNGLFPIISIFSFPLFVVLVPGHYLELQEPKDKDKAEQDEAHCVCFTNLCKLERRIGDVGEGHFRCMEWAAAGHNHS